MMDSLMDVFRHEPPWTLMYTDDIVICSQSTEQVKESLERNYSQQKHERTHGCE